MIRVLGRYDDIRSRSKSFRPDIQKPRQMENAVRGILCHLWLLVHRCEKCVEIKGDYVEKQQSCFISVTLKSWSGRKLLDPTMYVTTKFHMLSCNDLLIIANKPKATCIFCVEAIL